MVKRAAFIFREIKQKKRKGVQSKNASKSQNGYKKKYRGQGH